MKKTIMGLVLGCLLIALFFHPVFSQTNNHDIPGSNSSSTDELAMNNLKAIQNLNAYVIRSFEKSFKGAKDVCWTSNGNRHVAQFKMGDRNALVLFSKRGNILHSIFYGKEKHLPDPEKNQIQTIYEGYEIIHVEEINIGGEKVWLVLLRNCSNIVKVQLIDGELLELEKMTRSS